MIKTKLLSMILLTAILAVSMVAAANTFTVAPTSFDFIQPDNNFDFSITPTDPADNVLNHIYTIAAQTPILLDNGQAITFSPASVEGIGPIPTITITATNLDYDQLSIGKSYSGNLVLTKDADTSDTQTIAVDFVKSFCKDSEQGTDLEITEVKFDNNDGDDEEWSPLDKIEIEVEVSNNGDEKIKDVFVELGLFNSKGKNIARKDLEFENDGDEEIDLGSIKDDDEDTAIFTFTIPADFEADNYQLVVKAYSDDEGEDTLCTAKSSDLDNEYYHEISGEREEDEDKHVILDNIQVSPSIAQCEETVQVTAEVFNIGDKEYDDQVRVTLSIPELGLNLEETIREDFKEGDSEVVEFEFTIPPETTEKLYDMEFRTYYDYDDDDDTYDETSDDAFLSSFRVEGNCEVVQKSASITAELDDETPEAMPGKQVIINAELENTGDVETTYTVSVSGNSAWSDVVSLDPQIVTLAPGATREVILVLSINEDASAGKEEFKIRASFDAEMKEQLVELPISEETEAELGPVVEHLKTNWFIYLIILVNIILIIAIILVIRSMVAPRPM